MASGVSSMSRRSFLQSHTSKPDTVCRPAELPFCLFLPCAALTFPLGRAWTIEELRRKSFRDLHSLWWTCLKERNRLLTENATRKLVQAGYGFGEADQRIKTVNQTMSAIKAALVERYHGWQDARKLAKVDPSIYVNETSRPGRSLQYVYDRKVEDQIEPSQLQNQET